jgi:hypothetical protein
LFISYFTFIILSYYSIFYKKLCSLLTRAISFGLANKDYTRGESFRLPFIGLIGFYDKIS